MHSLFIGTSGYNYKDWKGQFYPETLSQRKWLAFYAEAFKTVEINATFYGSFSFAAYENWFSQVPDDFRFTIKGPRFLTHIKRLKDPSDSLERFFTAATGLGEKLSCVLWQLPANFQYKDGETDKRLTQFFSLLPQATRHVIEFRHESWFCEEVYALLRHHNIGFVINDSSIYPRRDEVTANFIYIRFHGPHELYTSKYSEEEVKKWADKIKEYRQSYDVYCYFNNDYFGYAIENAGQFLQFMA